MPPCALQSYYLRPATALFTPSCLPISSLKLEFPSALTP